MGLISLKNQIRRIRKLKYKQENNVILEETLYFFTIFFYYSLLNEKRAPLFEKVVLCLKVVFFKMLNTSVKKSLVNDLSSSFLPPFVEYFIMLYKKETR